jgi:hypothetical protein
MHPRRLSDFLCFEFVSAHSAFHQEEHRVSVVSDERFPEKIVFELHSTLYI